MAYSCENSRRTAVMPIELRRSAFAPCGLVPRVAEAMTQRRCGTLNLLRK
jgi:hypothetical protein